MKIIIIGGIAAGMSAAAKARRVDKEAEIIVFKMGDIISFGACGFPYFVGDFFQNPNWMIARKVQRMRDEGVVGFEGEERVQKVIRLPYQKHGTP